MSLTWVEATRLAAKGGRADQLRRGLIAVCAALGAMLLAAAASVPSFWRGPRSLGAAEQADHSVLGALLADRNLAWGVLLALVVAAVPVIHLMAQGVRVGALGRDRRLAAMRAAGATPADIRTVVRAEAFVCSAMGAVAGLLGFYALLVAAPHVFRIDYSPSGSGGVAGDTVPVLAVESWPNPVLMVAAAALVPALAAVVIPLTARRVGVRPEEPERLGDGLSPVVALSYIGCTVATVVCLLGLFVITPDVGARSTWWWPLYRLLGLILPLAAAGLFVTTLAVLAPGASSRIGRRLAERGGATRFLAGRMMTAHPRLASRTAVSLVLVAFAGALAIVVGGVLETELVRQPRWDGSPPEVGGVMPMDVLFYTVPAMVIQALAVLAAMLGGLGLLIAVAEQVSLRGPYLARQIAMGVPRRVIRRALVIEAAAPVVVMTTVALVVGSVVPVGVVLLGGDAGLLEGVRWERLVLLWVALVGGATLAAHVGGRGLAEAGGAGRIRDR